MVEDKKTLIEIFGMIIKPDKVKIFFLVISLFIFTILPFYPVNAKIGQYALSGSDYVLVESNESTTYESLFLVIFYDYSWTTQRPYFRDQVQMAEIIHYEADQNLMITWIFPLITLTYFMAMFAGQMYNWSSKENDPYEPDVHLWRPSKES